MGKVIVETGTKAKTINRYFHDCKLARQFAKENDAKVIRVDDKAKGKYLVQYIKSVKA